MVGASAAPPSGEVPRAIQTTNVRYPHSTVRGAWLLTLLLLVACGDPSGPVPSLVGCLVDREHLITDPLTLPSGFSVTPLEALLRTTGNFHGELERRDANRIPLHLRVEATGAMRLQRRSWQSWPGRGHEETADAIACEDTYAHPISVTLHAIPDLGLRPTPLLLLISARGVANLDLQLDLEAHRGSAATRRDSVVQFRRLRLVANRSCSRLAARCAVASGSRPSAAPGSSRRSIPTLAAVPASRPSVDSCLQRA